jgi:glutamate/tyrosine decarboxylase-like PLP-dependent enzyme
MSDLLKTVAERAINYINGLDRRSIAPLPEAITRLSLIDQELPQDSSDPSEVLALLDEVCSPATVATTGGRFFGFVTGGVLPAALAANWMAGVWDQNACLNVLSPAATRLEEIALRWLLNVLALPPNCGGALVTGATSANLTALAAARHAVLERVGWDVESQGLFGAPAVSVVVGEESHPSLLKTLGLLGMGRGRVITVPVDGQGRMRVDTLPPLSGPTIVCIQAGNVNSGAFDPAQEICAIAHEKNAWVHVDGAFGMWAAASPKFAHLTSGIPDADSWATDAHKWLNVPYDSGVAFVRNPETLKAAMSLSAAYLPQGDRREPLAYTPEISRRARGVEIWAALRSLGRLGLSELIERTCEHAKRFAGGLSAAGYRILNDVVINQVLVSFGHEEVTRNVIAGIQADGTCWCGGTVWQGHYAMRISVSSWATSESDVERSLDAMLRIAAETQKELRVASVN